MEGGIRLVKYCASAGMVAMVNRPPSGPSSFAVTLMVPIVPIVVAGVEPGDQKVCHGLTQFATAALCHHQKLKR